MIRSPATLTEYFLQVDHRLPEEATRVLKALGDQGRMNKEELSMTETKQGSGYMRPELEKKLPPQTLLVYGDKKREEGGQKLSTLPMSKKRGKGV